MNEMNPETTAMGPVMNMPKEGESQLAAQRKQDLINYVNNFYRSSWNWRSQKKHQDWNRWDQHYHSIYSPEAAARKEPWQTRMFIGLSVQTVEVIASQMFKTMMAPNPPVQVVAGPAGDPMQAELIQDVLEYEWVKGDFKANFYDALKEAARYGTGFVKFYWRRVQDTRMRKVPVMQSAEEVIQGAPVEALEGQIPMPTPRLKGYETKKQMVLLENHLCPKYIHIRDVFPEPNTTDWKKVIHREKISYGDIVKYIQAGAFFDVKEELKDVTESDKFEQDTMLIKHERGYFEQNREKALFEKKHTIWELYSEIPRKWIDFDIPEGDDAEVLVPAKVMVASGRALLTSEENPFFDGESPILKIDYIRTGEPYGKGVLELIQDEQSEINEIRNQRVDNVNLIMNRMMAVIETALVSAKDLVSKPGGIIRLKANVSDDIRKAIYPIEFPDVTQSAYRETAEIERQAQERTGANRVTLGTSNEVRDTNQTLGGMELLRQSFNERLAAYGMLIESQFLVKAAEKSYSLIYQELTPKDLETILGDDPVEIEPSPAPGIPPVEVPRYMAFVFVPPEKVNDAYLFKPMGIFSLENKIVKAAQVMDMIRINQGNPAFDFNSASKYVITKLQGIDEAGKWFIQPPAPTEIPGMPGMPPGMPGMPMQEPPGMKGGPNGNQPNFLPPDPLRRQPVVG